jgi:hypothetical protein
MDPDLKNVDLASICRVNFIYFGKIYIVILNKSLLWDNVCQWESILYLNVKSQKLLKSI